MTHNDDVIIRLAEPDDLDQLKLLDSVYFQERKVMVQPEFRAMENPSSIEILEKRISGECFRTIVAETNNKIIGYLVCKVQDVFLSENKREKEGRICDVFVCRGHRRKGIASRLYEKAKQWFQECDCRWEGLTVYAENPAKQLYEQWGYKSYSVNMRRKM
jgi:GNAT superfamily N-acetyltransferase